MKKLLLATVAAAALSLPAFAQSTSQPSNGTPSQQQMNEQNGTTGSAADQQQGMNQSQQATPIKASQLSKQEIQQIQINLNKQGFDAGHADGVWGHDTDVALKTFQEKQNLPGEGKLNQQTLQALGIDMTGQSNAQNQQASPGQQRQGAETTGQGSGENQGTQNQDMQNQQPNATPPSDSGSQNNDQQNQQ